MNYYDNNMTTEYIEEKNIPKEKHTNKKKLISMLILSTIILIILILGILFLMFKNKKNNNINLNNIIIENNTYEPTFSKDIYDYYLLTQDKEVEIKCDVNKDIEGCNTKINLSNYSNYIHEIINGEQIYKIYIRVKQSDSEENIVINSINKNNEWTNTNQVITINAESKNKIDKYSFDNGITWQESNVYTIENNITLHLIVKDEFGNLSPVREIDINNIDRINPAGIIIKEKASGNKITLKAVAKDEESGIDSYSWNDNEYTQNNELIIDKKGTYTVKVKDKAGNVETISIVIKDSDFNNKTQATITLYKNGSTNIGNDILGCTKNNGKCIVTLPNIAREEASIIGWSSNKDATEAEYGVNEKITIDKHMTLYAITKKEIEATFEKNGATSISSTKETCTLYNDDQYCYIIAPNITYPNGKIIGWNTEKDTQAPLKSPGNKIKLKNNQIYYALVYKEIVINFNLNGADQITSTKEVCRKERGNTSCFIITPNIIRENADIIGWSTNKNSTKSEFLVNEQVEVEDNNTYYAITKKEVTATFIPNGADSITNSKVSCSFYNTQKECEIITPNINRKNATIIGWSTNQNATVKELEANQNITINQNKKYFAITKKEVTATFNANGADSITESRKTCTYYNNADGCNITMPSINRNQWQIVGWNTNKNATSAQVKVQTNLNIKDDSAYYAITSRQLSATYHQNNADSLGNCTNPKQNGCVETCKIYNLDKSCEVKVPYIYSKGNEVQFFSFSSDPSTTIGYSPAGKLSILDNVTLYAIVDNRYRNYTYEIIKSKNYGYMPVETEASCSSANYTNYYNFIDRLYKKVPYIFTAAKVTFSGQNTFDSTWGNYAGMTYGSAIGYRNIDVKCPNTYSSYYLHTIVHELVHSWDSYFYAKKGYYLKTSSDFVNLYQKYKNLSNRPLREYSYTNTGEFVADAYAWYYFLYIDNSIQPNVVKSSPYYPKELKSVVEKYINIAKSGYK